MRLIDRDTLTDALGIADDCSSCEFKDGIFCRKSSDFVNACEAINEQPIIEERKAGKWIHDYDKNEALFFMQGWKCSACGRRQTYGESRFCMNCGAKMEHSDGYEERQRKLHEQILGREEDDA